MRTIVFINAYSRKASRHISSIRHFLAQQKKIEIVDYIVVDDLKHFDASLKRLQSHKDISCVIIGGGDGTVTAVINTLKNRKKLIYGLVPLGTTNVFARNLGLPTDLKKSLQVIANYEVRPINLGSVNGVLFTSTTGIGLTVKVVKHIKNHSKRFFGFWAYDLMAFRLLPWHQPVRGELQVGGEIKNFSVFDLSIATGSYYGPVKVSKDASIYDDNLTIMYGTDPNRVGFTKDVHSFLVNRQHKQRHVVIVRAPKVILKTERPEDLQADGELIGQQTPAEIKLIKNAIQVMVPRKH